MIARCDRCDARKEWPAGYRWDPRVAPLSRHVCPECGGKLRPKRPGESEANIVAARPPKPKKLAGDVRRARAKVKAKR